MVRNDQVEPELSGERSEDEDIKCEMLIKITDVEDEDILAGPSILPSTSRNRYDQIKLKLSGERSEENDNEGELLSENTDDEDDNVLPGPYDQMELELSGESTEDENCQPESRDNYCNRSLRTIIGTKYYPVNKITFEPSTRVSRMSDKTVNQLSEN